MGNSHPSLPLSLLFYVRSLGGGRRKKALLNCMCSVAKTGKIHFAPKWPKGPKWNCTVVRSSSKNIRYKIYSCVCVTYIRQKATKGGTENYSSFGRSPEVQVENGFGPGRGTKGLWAALRGEALYVVPSFNFFARTFW